MIYSNQFRGSRTCRMVFSMISRIINKTEFEEFFQMRNDVFMEQQADGGYLPVKKPLTSKDIQDHLDGKHTYGMYLVKPEVNTTRFTVIDIDRKDTALVTTVIEASKTLGIPREQILVEFSGRKGYHVWIRFEQEVQAWKAKELGEVIIEKGGLDPKTEIFPKQAKVAKGGFGNCIKLPLGIHKVSGNRSCFVDDDFQTINDWKQLLNNHKSVSVSQLDAILKQQKTSSTNTTPTQASIEVPFLPQELQILHQNGVMQGQRDDKTFEFAKELRKMGYEKSDIIPFLVQWDRDKNQPPLGEKVVIEKIDSTFKKDTPTTKTPKKLQPISIDELLAKQFKDDYYLGNAVLDKKSKLIIGGEPKTQKSFFVLDMAISLATGEDFLNIPVMKKTKVLYVFGEGSEKEIQRRIRSMTQSVSIEKTHFGFLKTTNFNICNDESWERLTNCLDENSYEVVIFDPLIMFHRSDENTSNGMAEVVDRFDQLIDKFGISICITHHFNKGNSSNNDPNRLRGSSVVHGWGDSFLFLTRMKKNTETIRVSSQFRNGAEMDEISIRLKSNLRFELVGGSKTKKLEVRDLVRIVSNLGGNSVPQPDIIKEAHNLKVVSESTVRRILKEAYRQKQLDCDSSKPINWSIIRHP